MSGVVLWLRPDSRLAFWRPVRLMHRTLRMQARIFADVRLRKEKVNQVGFPSSWFNKPDKNRFWSFVSWKGMGAEWARILYSTNFVQKNRYIPGSFLRFDLGDQ